MISSRKYLETSCLGMVRGTTVQLLIHPLQTIKTNLQATPLTSSATIYKIFQQRGARGFYSGLVPKLIDTNIKQFWVWPLIQATPQFLEQKDITALPAQALTGLIVATFDATLSTPLEAAKIRSMVAERQNPFASLFKSDGKGFAANWSRLTVQWTTFLTAQSYFRNQYKTKQGETLTLAQLICAGTKTALVVSIAAAPFDTANTLVQISQSLSNRTTRYMYRGWSYSAVALIIHNIASITLLEHLDKRK